MNTRTLFIYLIFFLSLFTHIQAQDLAYTPHYEVGIDLKKIDGQPKRVVNLKALLVICDNYISPDNNGIAQSVRVDMGTITQLFNTLEKRNIVKVEKTILQGSKATLFNIRNAMRNLNAGSDDIIFFYFSGHGGMENGKTFLFSADEKNLQRSEVEAAFNAQTARLKMIITDACSNAVDGLAATRSLSKANTDIEAGAFDNIYKNLFLNHKGVMHLSASSEGEYAWSNDNFGGFFTYHFIKEGLIKKPINNWQAIFQNAKDKTSQMFMRMPSDQRAQLSKEGVNNQTAKAFAMPVLATGNVANNNQTINTTNEILNEVFNFNSKGKITIENYATTPINFFLDNNRANQTWTQANLKRMSVAAGKSVVINQGYAVVCFNSDGKDTYYSLENDGTTKATGNYFFATDENNVLDLFYRDDNINAQNFNTVAQMDYTQLLLSGKWEWEDVSTNETVITTFYRNNTFTDQYPQTSGNGEWIIAREKFEGKDYTILTFIVKDDDGVELEIDYAVMLEEEYPDEVQLVFITAYENGEEMTYEEAEEYFEPTIMMYKVY
jgi:hypothetical protein